MARLPLNFEDPSTVLFRPLVDAGAGSDRLLREPLIIPESTRFSGIHPGLQSPLQLAGDGPGRHVQCMLGTRVQGDSRTAGTLDVADQHAGHGPATAATTRRTMSGRKLAGQTFGSHAATIPAALNAEAGNGAPSYV